MIDQVKPVCPKAAHERHRKRSYICLSNARRSVDGRRSTLYAPLGSVSQAQGENCEISSYIHQRVQNSNNSRRLQHLDLASIEVIPLGGKTFKAQKCAIILGGPMRVCPCGCQANTVLIQQVVLRNTVPNSTGIRRLISDHDLNPIREVKARTR